MAASSGQSARELKPSRMRQIAPALGLALLSPIISELLSGSTRISDSFVLLPEIGVWGCGALLIRYFVRSRNKTGWASIFVLGIALAMAEELIIQQTSLTPIAGLNAYGRFFGVNWIYLIWALGYESIWVVVLPIALTEIIFPSRREETWIGRRGLLLASIYFVLGAIVAWYSWTHFEVPIFDHGATYTPSWAYILIALVAITACIFAARDLANQKTSRKIDLNNGSVSSLKWAGELGVSCTLSLGWSALIFLAEGINHNFPLPLAFVIAIAISSIAFFVVRSWLGTTPSFARNFHQLAFIFGAMLGSMSAGIIAMRVSGGLQIDFVADIVLNVVAILLLAYLVKKTKKSMMVGDIHGKI
jgi:hypothetical protein